MNDLFMEILSSEIGVWLEVLRNQNVEKRISHALNTEVSTCNYDEFTMFLRHKR